MVSLENTCSFSPLKEWKHLTITHKATFKLKLQMAFAFCSIEAGEILVAGYNSSRHNLIRVYNSNGEEDERLPGDIQCNHISGMLQVKRNMFKI